MSGLPAIPALVLLACGVAAQRPRDGASRKEVPPDPYTEAEPEAMAACGYVSFGPFPFADEHWTRDIEEALGSELQLRWIETRHFKIGMGLRDRPLTKDQKARRRLMKELKTLREKLPTVPRRVRKLDSWLLAHLYAHRVEQLYEDFRERAGLPAAADQETPGEPADGRGWRDRGGVGAGSYLGQHGKFGLLVFERKADIGRYLNRFAGRDYDESVSHHFLGSNSLVFLTASEAHGGWLSAEEALHCNVVFGVARMLVDGAHGYGYELPAWLREGLAHWYRRNLDPRFNNFGNIPVNQELVMEDTDWEPKVYGYVRSGAYAKAEEALRWRYEDLTKVPQHRNVWSRAEYLMSLGDEKFAEFLKLLRSMPPATPWEQVLKKQDEALQEVYGFDGPEGFDEAWTEHVLKTYSRR